MKCVENYVKHRRTETRTNGGMSGVGEDLRKKRDAYFAELAAETESAAAKKKRQQQRGSVGAKRGQQQQQQQQVSRGNAGVAGTGTGSAAIVSSSSSLGAARGRVGVLKTSGLALSSARASGGAKAAAAPAGSVGGGKAGGKTITGIPDAPGGDPRDLDLTKHDGRRFAKMTLPRECAPGSELRVQIFPNGPIVRLIVPETAKGGDELEFAVEPWTEDDVPPKAPAHGDDDDEDEVPPPPPPPGAPPAGAPMGIFVGRAPPPPPPPPGAGFVVGEVPPPPPGSP
jgi:hypothetical protein